MSVIGDVLLDFAVYFKRIKIFKDNKLEGYKETYEGAVS